jgi:hypothetical protein
MLDVVFLGDDLVEMWTGLGLNVPLADPNGQEIQKIFNRTFTKAGGGALDGLAMGIRGDSVRLTIEAYTGNCASEAYTGNCASESAICRSHSWLDIACCFTVSPPTYCGGCSTARCIPS